MSSDAEPEVVRWDAGHAAPREIEAILRQRLATLGFAVTRHLYPPGTRFPPHTHDVEKIDAVVSGRLRITMGSHVVLLGPGDALRVPRGVVHGAAVVGEEPVVSLDAVKALKDAPFRPTREA
jgi:quercetin dioxygenase-like cupin family protein